MTAYRRRPTMNLSPARFRAFTMIELLVVIAIIAILAAIIFPVFNRVREQSRQAACMTQMHDIYVAVKQYREDNDKYPASLLGFVQVAATDPNGHQEFYTGANGPSLQIDQLTYRPLTKGQKYLNDKNAFHCPDSNMNDPTVTSTAVYPQGTPLAGQPVMFTSLMHHNIGDDWAVPVGMNAYYYIFDSYDVGPQVTSAGVATPVTNELHYSLDWTGQPPGPTDTCPSHPDGLCGNQLKYPNAPYDQTVITWCTYHVAQAHVDKVLVMFLSGTAKPVDVGTFVTKGPLNYAY